MSRTLLLIKGCLFLAMCSDLVWPCVGRADYPAGAIPRESEVQDRFFAAQVPAENLSEVRLIRFSDSTENVPNDWNAIRKSEQAVITKHADIAAIVNGLKHAATSPEYKKSPCPALGAFVGQLRNPTGEWVVLFFYAHDDHLMLQSPSGMSLDNKELWQYVKDKYPNLLRPTRGAEVTTKASAGETNLRRIFYSDGSLRTEIPIVDGKYNGIGKSYFKNGQVSLTLPFTDGKLNGIGKSYAENGKLLEEVAYAAGERHGAGRVYCENGKVLVTNWWWHGKNVSEEEFERRKRETAR